MSEMHRYAYAFQTRPKSSPPVSPQKKPRTRIYGGILIVRHPTDPFLDRYALVQGRYTGKWSFPKGHSNEGEEPLECTLREVEEETGIANLPDPVDYIRIGYGNYHIFYLDRIIDLVPQDTHEIIKTVWATIGEMELLSINVDVNRYRKTWLKRHQCFDSLPNDVEDQSNENKTMD